MGGENFYFPYEKIRPVQAEMMEEIGDALEKHCHMVIHAPTGIGKTAAVLGPALKHAISHKAVLFFLTSRHTQHRIVIDTLKEIKEKFKIDFTVSDMIGKRAMCSQKGIEKLGPSDFFDYCKVMREENRCSHFINLRAKGKMTPEAAELIVRLKFSNPNHVEDLVRECKNVGLCPYEIALILSREANVVVADYSYLFNPVIRDIFFSKLNKGLDQAIIIVDEAHNLPGRLRETLSDALGTITLSSAVRELKLFNMNELAEKVAEVLEGLNHLGFGVKNERIVKKSEFVDLIDDYGLLQTELEAAAITIRQAKQRSWSGSVAKFLGNWNGPDEGFVRVLKNTGKMLVLSYRGLDPGMLSRDIIDKSYATVAMSGTLTPTAMFKDVLGFPDNTRLLEYGSPFPEENRLSMILPITSTRFTSRSEDEYKRIALVCDELISNIPGNLAIFFPSYLLRDEIARHIEPGHKKMFYEKRGMGKEGKQALLEAFKKEAKSGAILLGVVRGSFGEGIDLPGDFLNGVVVVGLPLAVPDAETKALIDYFQARYNKGIEYGYIFPAITLALQSAGRCIRSEQDRGVVVFLDERYAYPRYMGCFPRDRGYVVTRDFVPYIEDFFRK